MEKRNAVEEPVEPTFDSIERFKPTVRSSTRLYHNGNQQVFIEVEFRALKDMLPVALTEAEEKSVGLVMYNTGEPIPSEWVVSEEWNQYSYYPGSDSAEIKPARIKRDDERKLYVFELYVSTTETGGLSRKFALAITRNDGLHIVTNGETPMFDVHVDDVTLQPVKPPTYALGNYEWEKNIMFMEEGKTPVFVANYYLGLVGNDNQPIELRTMKVVEGGMIQWNDKVETETFASYTGYGEPGEDDAHYNLAIEYGSHVREGKVRSPIEGKGTIILVGAVDIPFDRESAVDRGGPCQIEAVDQYGNAHALKVRFKEKDDPEGRFDLVLV